MQTILRCRVGSHCHGTAMPDSDTDIRTIFIPTKDYFLGLKHIDMIEDRKDGQDIEHWNIQKLFGLCIKGNPSALNILHGRNADRFFIDPWGARLLEIKDQFLSKRTITSIVGYTISQIDKLDIGRGSKEGKRKEMIDKYGYDVKFCYHSVMLTYMGIELIKSGVYRPYRGKAEQTYLREIRQGKVPLEEVRALVKSNLETIKTIESVCTLPAIPDEEKLNQFITDLLWEYYRDENFCNR